MDPTRRLELAYLLAIGGDARPLAERLAQVDADLVAARPAPPAPDAPVGTRSSFDPRRRERRTVTILADGREVEARITEDGAGRATEAGAARIIEDT